MAKQVIHRLGTTAEHNNFIGAEGEWTHDVDLTTIRVHDGVTVGGFALAKSDNQALTNVDINSGTIDGTAIGNTTPSTGNFSDVTVNGNLTVLGTTTSIETTDLVIDDLNITIANGAADAASADGAGITIDGANATITYSSSSDAFVFNKSISASTINTGQGDNELYAMDQNVRTTDSVAFEAIAVDSDTLVVDNINARVGIGTGTPTTDLDVVGNIAVSGTVDGRDVSADGSKLDGIEANADVTDTANVTAAGALMDSELTNEAAVKAINQQLTTTSDVTFNSVTANEIDCGSIA